MPGILLEFNHYARTRDDAWTRAAQLFRLTLADMSGDTSVFRTKVLAFFGPLPAKSLEIVLYNLPVQALTKSSFARTTHNY
jgi:hypothetical protein